MASAERTLSPFAGAGGWRRLIAWLALLFGPALAQVDARLADLSIEELAAIQVRSVSRAKHGRRGRVGVGDQAREYPPLRRAQPAEGGRLDANLDLALFGQNINGRHAD